VLSSWGNPLTGIYVISVPAGTRMITGLTSPMQAGDEFRAGGATQYWLNSRDNAWLVHALYAPDYVGSYVLALAGAQKLNRDAHDGLSAQLRSFAIRNDQTGFATGNKTESWFRATANDTDYQPGMEHGINARGHGCMLGWGMTRSGNHTSARLHAGVVIGRSSLRQLDTINHLEGQIDNNYGGLYAIYRRPAAEPFAWYVCGSALRGRLWFDNSVPGYLGKGLQQSYRNHLTSAALEAGVPLTLGLGWTVTPQAQVATSRVNPSSFIDELGATISVKQSRSNRARLGAQFEKTILQHSHRLLSVTAGGGAIREFSGSNRIEVSGETVTGLQSRSVYQIDIGIRCAWAGRYMIQADFGRQYGDEQGYHGSASLNLSW
jgi:outer membrane autotransporter protein